MDRAHHRRRRRGCRDRGGGGLFRPGLSRRWALACLLPLLTVGCHHKLVVDDRLDPEAAEALARQVSAQRGLDFLRPVTLRLSGPGDLRRLAQDEAGRARAGGRSEREGELLGLLGLVPPGADLATGLEAIASEQPGGAYLPRAERLELYDRPRVRSEVIELLDALLGRDLTFGEIAAHELVHALQDQHFGLEGRGDEEANQDAALAHRALAEGDAFLVGFELGLGGLLSTPEGFLAFARAHAPDLGEQVPAYLQERFKFPYLDGAAFVLALKASAPGFEAVDAAHRAPPRSTEEILHPERYLSGGDPPRRLSLAEVEQELRLDDAGLELVYQDTLGELGVRSLVGARAAAGWGGDRAGLWVRRRDEARLVVWVTVWDSPAEALELFDGLETRARERFGEPDEAEADGESRWERDGRRRVLHLRDDRVVWLDGPADLELMRPMLAALGSPDRAEPRPVPSTIPPADKRPADKRPAPGRACQVDPRIPSPRKEGPLVRLGTDSLGLELGALLQVRATRGDGVEGSGLGLQRMRLRAKGNASAGLDLGLAVELELSGEEELLQEAVLSFSPVSPALLYLGHLRVGRQRTAVTRAALLLPEEQPLVEETRLALELSPRNRVGIAYDLDLGRYALPLRLRAGASDGFPEGIGRGPLLSARLELTQYDVLDGLITLAAGAAYAQDRAFSPDTLESGRDVGMTAFDLSLGIGPVWLEGEVLWSDRLAGGGWESLGWSAGLGGYALPDFLALLGRYEELRRLDGSAEPDRRVTFGAALLYLGPRFRLMYNLIWDLPAGLPDRFQHALQFQLRL
jgi:hypothetical protein